MSAHDCNATPFGSLFSWHWMYLYILRNLLNRLEVHAQRVFVEGSAGLEEVLEAINLRPGDQADRAVVARAAGGHSGPVRARLCPSSRGEPIEYLESEPWLVEFWARDQRPRLRVTWTILLMGGVIACGGACFAWISTIAVTLLPEQTDA